MTSTDAPGSPPVEPESSSDTVMAVDAKQADHLGLQGRHHPGTRTGAHLGGVLTAGHVADPMQRVLDPLK